MSYVSIKAMNIDTHFHIFDKNQVRSEHSRYVIDYDASIEGWIKEASKQKITCGVIVQPSFLGFDNSLLLKTIAQYPEHLRGIGAVDPKTSQKELMGLSSQGMRGVRLNLFGDQDPLGTLEKYRNLISLLNGVNMHLQIHHNDGLLNEILLNIPAGIKVVVDHFGRPEINDEFEKASAGIDQHLGNLWIKLSAQYRTPNIHHRSIYEYWLKKIGISRLLWGSDWPHTRFEGSETYENQMKEFLALTQDAGAIHRILCDNPRSLYPNKSSLNPRCNISALVHIDAIS
jgi:predicted TIM-barrel fold metal-dependent hydrolase